MLGPGRRSMVLIGLKATGLKDHHFLLIIDAMSGLSRCAPPVEGRAPERLELLDHQLGCELRFVLYAARVIRLTLLLGRC